jgi:hypothetical protein
MWVFSISIYAGCKWLTFVAAAPRLHPTSLARTLAYLLGWPGMDAEEFLSAKAVSRPRPLEWLRAVGNLALGSVIVWRVTPEIDHPLAAGAVGMTGMILMLHFGLMQLIALGWRVAGFNAVPLMDHPANSVSLAEFWGRRWNTAFHELAWRFVFHPLVRRMGARGALLAAFLASGLVHDLVISVPARGGYGLPTAYFLMQGMGVLAERSKAGRRLGLGRGGRGWGFTCLFTAGPVLLLFHPLFLERIILPMLRAMGAH